MRGLTDEEREMLTWRHGDPEELENAAEREWSIATQLVADGRGQFVWMRIYDDGVRYVEHLLL